MAIKVIRGIDADRLLESETFRVQWRSLWDRCPWATAFQTPGFVLTWYATYRHQFEPILIASFAADGNPDGLLTLARPLDAGDKVIFAGRHQAEYHTWICAADQADAFPPLALEALRREMPRATLRFHYLPGDVPLGWLAQPRWRRRCFVHTQRRPLLTLGDGQEVRASLAKGSNKSKLKRLDHLGGMTFARVTDPAELDALFDEIGQLYDLRHGAVHGSGSLHTTDLQRPFHVALLGIPGLLHFTVMRVGGRLAAAHFGACGRKEVQLGIIVHDPTLAKHSPGKLLLLLLSKMLLEEGFERFDLTPSGDAYKERFANDGDSVHTLSVHPTPAANARFLLRERVKHGSRQLAKRTLTRLHVNPLRFKLLVRDILRPASLRRLLLRSSPTGRMRPETESRHYSRVVDGGSSSIPDAAVRRGSIADLLAYVPARDGASRQAFLADALSRLERGEKPYTIAEDGRLTRVAWLVEPDEVNERPAADGTVSAGNAVITLPATFPADPSHEPTTALVSAIVADLAAKPFATRLSIAIPACEASIREAVERLGFAADPAPPAAEAGRPHSGLGCLQLSSAAPPAARR